MRFGGGLLWDLMSRGVKLKQLDSREFCCSFTPDFSSECDDLDILFGFMILHARLNVVKHTVLI
jgi:hypothetical protein